MKKVAPLAWHNEKRKISELVEWEKNPRKISERDKTELQKCIEKFNYTNPAIINLDNKLVAGHMRLRAMAALGRVTEEVDVRVPNRMLTTQEHEELAIRDNKNTGEWDAELLRAFPAEFLFEIGFSLDELEVSFDGISTKGEAKAKLTKDFIVPPFSVLDSRQGYWQDRKVLWNDLGIHSDASREEMETSGSLSGSVPHYYEFKRKTEKLIGRKLNNKEFEEKYLEHYIAENSLIKTTNTGGMLSVFDPVLCEIAYRWFVPRSGLILDPFAGGSVRGIVAETLGYQYHGIDLREAQVKANYENARDLFHNGHKIKWTTGDSIQVLKKKENPKYDFVFSCPPYGDLEKYSDDKRDLSNMSYYNFMQAYRKIITLAMGRLKQNRFACFVVGDIRDENGHYRNFVSDTIDCFTKCTDEHGHHAHLYNEMILLNQIGSLPIRVGRQFQTSRKVGKAHQNVLVFYKGDPDKIREEFPEIKNLEKMLQEKNYEPSLLPSEIPLRVYLEKSEATESL